MNIKLGNIWGIPIRLHLSWFLIFALVTWSLAVGYFPSQYPALTQQTAWVLGAVTAVLFALSVLLHELGHAYFALRSGIPIKGITLFLFGGLAQLSREPDSAGAEFKIAIAGPAVSFSLAAFFGVIYVIDYALPAVALPALTGPAMWLLRINFILATFNLIPGFPLDGGRVLRAIMWKITGSEVKATRIATISGQVIAYGFMAFGLFLALTTNVFNGVWLIFIGWFLGNMAKNSRAHLDLRQRLEGLTVSMLMNRHLATVPAEMSISRLVQDRIVPSGDRFFLVNGGNFGEVRGVVTMGAIKSVPRKEWDYATVEDAMLAASDMVSVPPQMELVSALETMEEAHLPEVPVMEHDVVTGVLSRDEVIDYLRTRSDIGM
jgi:Zn-dependent protease/CBS domain-containing protein